MKKVTTLVLLLAISLSLIGSSQAEMGGIKLRDFPSHSLLNQTLKLHSPYPLGKLVILPIGEFDQIQAAGIISRVDQLPASLLNKIVKEDIKLKLFVGKLTDNPSAKGLAGIIPRGYKSNTTWDKVPGIGGGKTVLVKIGSSEKGEGHGSVNLELHELAHSIDKYVYNGIRYDPRYLAIWTKECAVLFPNQDYFLSYPEEYFAEAFAMYYLNKQTRFILQAKAPETFHYIKKLN